MTAKDGSDTQASPSSADDLDEELRSIKRHYKETFLPNNPWASLINTFPYLVQRQRHRRIRDALLEHGVRTSERLRELDVLDVGCGAGSNLGWLAELGADPARLTGNDLIEDRIAIARAKHPQMRWIAGSILDADVGGPFDMVMLLAVLTSVTNAVMKRRIVERCFELLKPGGLFFFYDLVSRREKKGTKHYKMLTFSELESYVGGRPIRYFRRDFLKASVAEWVIPRFGVAAAEMLQSTGLFNMDGTFAYVRADRQG